MAETATQNRLLSLDAFRGMTIAGMTLVNNPGSWAHIYGPLEHAEWNGLTPTDLVFPFFLFIVGVSISLSLGKRVDTGIDRSIYGKIISRAVLIYILGALVSILPFFSYSKTNIPAELKMVIWLVFSASVFFFLLRNYKIGAALATVAVVATAVCYFAGYTITPYNFAGIRYAGVLQRISVCYLIVAILFLHTNWRQQLGLGVVLLLGYWLVMTVIPVPGCDITTVDDKACNLAAYVDRMVIGVDHIWRQAKVYDPEGLLSTIPAIVTTISGVLTGTWLLRKDESGRIEGEVRTEDTADSSDSQPISQVSSLNKVSGIFFFGVVLFAIGWTWGHYFPINKALWTSSYVLITSGLALCLLGFCYWLIDIKNYRRWAKPFMIFGANAIALFVFSDLMARMIDDYNLTGSDGQPISIQGWIYNSLLSVFQPIDASLMFAIGFVLLWLFLMWLLYRKQIYIKV